MTEKVNKEKVSLKNVWFFNMDEYITEDGKWIDIDHPLSFRGFMRDHVYTMINPDLVMSESHRIFPDPDDPGYCDRMLSDLGGADMCVGGIGINGHVAFNKADESLTGVIFLKQTTRIRPVSPATIVTGAIGSYHGALEEMPKYCITIGMKQIYTSKVIRLGCFRDWHRGVVRRATFGDPTAAFPVTLLQSHPDTRIMITEYVATLD